MSKAGKKLIAAMKEALAMAMGEIATEDRITKDGVRVISPDKREKPRLDLSTIEGRNTFYNSDEYQNMSTAEKCAVQRDGFTNDYD
jgi:hypothetical protein